MIKPKNSNTIPQTQALRRRIRVRKQDSAFVYCILESYEGIVSYSTLDSKPDDPHRDLELNVPPDFSGEVNELLTDLGDLIYTIPLYQSCAFAKSFEFGPGVQKEASCTHVLVTKAIN
jgi:hypothetical protein